MTCFFCFVLWCGDGTDHKQTLFRQTYRYPDLYLIILLQQKKVIVTVI